MRKNHAKLISKLEKKLSNEEFILKHRTIESAFTRRRSFTFKSLSLFILGSIQSGLQRELDRFFKKYNNTAIAEQFVSKSAFCQARKKICPKAFSELNDLSVAHFYENYKYHKWKSHRLIAIDGSEVLLPSNAGTIDEFGDYSHRRSEKSVVLARYSKYYDVLNRVSIDAILTQRSNGEQYLAEQHLKYSKKEDLLLLDRGYPSLMLFRKFLTAGVNFCSRLTIKNWKIAQELLASPDDDVQVEIKISKYLIKKFYRQGVETSPLKLRLIKVKLKTGETEILITSLLDEVKYPTSCFKSLYNLRWGVEESYKVDKHQIRIEDFSGTTVQSINQEFNSLILLSNLASIFSYMPIKEVKLKVHRYKINATVAISKFREDLVTLFREIGDVPIIMKLVTTIWKNLIPIREGRSYERKVYRRRRYHMQYKNL